MPDDVQVLDQAPPETPEAQPPAPAEAQISDTSEIVPSAEVPAEGAAEPAGDGGLVEPAPPAEPSTLEDLTARYPFLSDRLKERDRDRENAGAQRREAQLRREAGSKERVRQDVGLFLQAVGVDPDEAVEAQPQFRRAEFLYTLAEARAASDLAGALPEVIKTEFEIPPEAREAAARIFDTPLNEQGDRDHRGYIRALFDGAVEGEVKKREAAIRAEVEAANRKWRADEERALRTQNTPQPAGSVAVPVGASGRRMTRAELDAMPTNQFLALPLAEQQRLTQEARSG